jgi:hypothetical protein
VWNCPRCSYENPTYRYNCIQCGLGRNENADVAAFGGGPLVDSGPAISFTSIQLFLGIVLVVALMLGGGYWGYKHFLGGPQALNFSTASVAGVNVSTEPVIAKFPWAPERHSEPLAGMNMVYYEADKGDLAYGVFYAELPTSVPYPVPAYMQDAMFSGSLAGGIANLHDGKVIDSNRSTIDGDPAMTATIKGSTNEDAGMSEEGYAKLQVRLHQHMVVVALVASKHKNFPLFDKFVSSLQFPAVS